MKNPPQRKRILFVAEAATLAHVARPLALAQSLDPALYDVHFASADRFHFAFQNTDLKRWGINSISTEAFLRSLARGSRLYTYSDLDSYVRDDLRIMADVRPDLVIGDFRLSLAVSAAVAKVPYAALANAYWSPYSTQEVFPLPDLAVTRVLSYRLSNKVFNLCRPLIFAYHARPLNRLRRRYGLPKLAGLQDAYTHADYTLYADPPDLYPTTNLPSHHRFLGPIDWSPQIPLPPWWAELPKTEPVIYATLGSSGPAHLLPSVIAALKAIGAAAVISTAGRCDLPSLPKNIKAADFLPGREALRQANLAICNGGSPSVYQALSQGVPVLGITSNMDQMLAMGQIEKAQAGIHLRAMQADTSAIKAAITVLTSEPRYSESAAKLKESWAHTDSFENFRLFLAEILAS